VICPRGVEREEEREKGRREAGGERERERQKREREKMATTTTTTTTPTGTPTLGGGAATGAGKGRSRARLLLSNYYGVGSEESTATALNPKNIDGAVFNADLYFDDLLAQKDLKSLIKIDNDLLAETKKLDSDMKTLVYENYNKFISATDTIRQMKKNVVNMEEEIKRLAENMEKISSCSDEINLTLSMRREKIEELSGVYRLLKKVSFVVCLFVCFWWISSGFRCMLPLVAFAN